MQSDLVAVVEADTLRKPSISGVELSQEIEGPFGGPVSRTTINVHVPWIDAEDGQLIQDWLTIGPHWKSLEKSG
jgi:hypothetical protein